ncbi:unnamed protein product [Vicia faba]|uniref:Uncharacterized protein n=1 Tax=Vicia faba TaxID=3906 RepID=A0AAV1BBS0_VICFA|nr:unnamed protein product [Vicia faba]
MVTEALQDVKSNIYTRLFHLPRECNAVDSFFSFSKFICFEYKRITSVIGAIESKSVMLPTHKHRQGRIEMKDENYIYNMLLYRDTHYPCFSSHIAKSKGTTPLDKLS